MITVGTAEGLAGRGTERIRRGLERAIELDLEALVAYGVWARWASSASC
jgi:hypothetical protein